MSKPGAFTQLIVGSLLIGPVLSIAPVRGAAPPIEILHSFSGSDGSDPGGPLLAVGRELWGTTSWGGQFGWGSIFRISRTGALTTLYSFFGLGDGASPQRLVLGPDGAVYGTTEEVRQNGGKPTIPGTLFRIAPSGALLTLFVFRTVENGYAPGGLTVAHDGSIFGWTANGGPGGNGTVFRASTDGSLALVYAFSPNDQVAPLTGDLIEGADGNLWGTGGTSYANGSVFKLTRNGALTVVHAFSVRTFGLMVGNDGKMYGTLDHEGIPSFRMWMFSITTSGVLAQQVGSFLNGSVEFLTQTTDGTLFANLGGALARVTSDLTYTFVVSLPGYGVKLMDGLDGYLYGISANGGVNNAGTVFRVSSAARHTNALGDFDCDGQADITVYRPSTGYWYTLGSIYEYYLGQPGDLPVAANYEGAAFTNRAIYRPSTGTWFVDLFGGDSLIRQWGSLGDVPLPADYDGDGKADLAVYRPSTGTWFVLKSSSSYTAWETSAWGLASDIPVPGDYDGDGKSDRAVYRPANGTWYILESASNNTRWTTYSWGLPGDIPVPGDYDGDGITDLAVYRPSNGTWYIALSTTNYTTWFTRQWGLGGDIPVPTDYDGDGLVDIAVYRPTINEWFILKSSKGFAAWDSYLWGIPGDIAVP